MHFADILLEILEVLGVLLEETSSRLLSLSESSEGCSSSLSFSCISIISKPSKYFTIGMKKDDGESSNGSSTEVLVELGRSLEKTGVQVEDVTGVGLSSWRSPEQERHLSVSNSLLGKIVVDDEGVLSVISEVLSDGASRIWGQELERGGLGGSGGHHNGVSQGVVVVQGLHDVGHGGSFLANSHVDAEQLLLGVS